MDKLNEIENYQNLRAIQEQKWKQSKAFPYF